MRCWSDYGDSLPRVAGLPGIEYFPNADADVLVAVASTANLALQFLMRKEDLLDFHK